MVIGNDLQERRGDGDGERARNVILLIGDGMGQAHRFAGQLASVGLDHRLLMDRLPVAGLMRTTSADAATFVTDSAAAATAMATGVKTYNGAISLGPDRVPVPTVLEIAKWAGKSVGLVTTCQVTDATPAAFGAHVAQRADQREIARQYLEESRVDVILGGGAAFWHPETPLAPGNGSTQPRASGDLIGRARELGYAFAATPDDLRIAARSHDQVLGLLAEQELFTQGAEWSGAAYDPPMSLAEMTQTALSILSRNPEGFFVMIEEAAIDRMAHRNNAPLTLRGVQELDAAVAIAIRFAEHHPDTLVVVAADHETGGLAVTGPDDPAYSYEVDDLSDEEAELAGEDGPFRVAGSDSLRFVVGWTTTGHTSAAVPVTAAGPGAGQLIGAYENTHVPRVLVEAMGLRVGVR